jgi:hypothetical protein
MRTRTVVVANPQYSDRSLAAATISAFAQATAPAPDETPLSPRGRDEWSEPPLQPAVAARITQSRMRLEITGVMAAIACSAMGNLIALACTAPILNVMRLGAFNEFRL